MHLTLLYIKVKLFLKNFDSEFNLKILILSFALKILVCYTNCQNNVSKQKFWLVEDLRRIAESDQSIRTSGVTKYGDENESKIFHIMIFFCDIYLFQY